MHRTINHLKKDMTSKTRKIAFTTGIIFFALFAIGSNVLLLTGCGEKGSNDTNADSIEAIFQRGSKARQRTLPAKHGTMD